MKNNIRPLKLHIDFENIYDEIYGCICSLAKPDLCDFGQTNIVRHLIEGNYVQTDSLIQETKEQLRIWNNEE